MVTTTTTNVKNTEVDIAVLQVQVSTIEDKLADIKQDIQQLQRSMETSIVDTRALFNEFRKNSDQAHRELSEKVSHLEKWRWMIMGAGVFVGALGFDVIKKLLLM